MKKMRPNKMSLFAKASELRSEIKQMQQLSWTVTQFEKQFPFEQIVNEDLEDLTSHYLKFCLEIIELGKKLDEKISKDEYLDMLKNENTNNTDTVLGR